MTFFAGTALREISPQKPLFLVGYPHVPRISEGINDPLYASALCLKSANNAILLISLDLLFITPEKALCIRQKISSITGISVTSTMITCTHTHSGPMTGHMLAWESDSVVSEPDPEYMELLEKNILDAAVEAQEKLEESEFASTSAYIEGAGCNRNDPSGQRDSEAGIVVVRNAKNKKTIAVSIIYSMHPTVLHEDSKLVSSDFVGYTRKYLNANLDKHTIITYHMGPSGNQSPRYHVKGQTFEEAERIGYILGTALLKEITKLADCNFNTDIVVNAMTSVVKLPSKSFMSLKDAEKNLEKASKTFEKLKIENAPYGLVRTAECAVFGAEETYFLAQCNEDGRLDKAVARYENAEVQVIRLGDIFLAGFPCEIFVEYGLDLKKRASAKVFPVSLVNGELQGYVVTPEAAIVGGYEADNGIFLPESGAIMLDKILQLIKEMTP